MGRTLSHEIQTGKHNEKPLHVTESRHRMNLHLSVAGNTWAGPWAGPSKPRAAPRNGRAGPYRARVSWASLPCDGPGQGETFENDGPGRVGPGREFLKM